MTARGQAFRVTAREVEGFNDYRRAGEAWPRGAGKFREVLVLDQDEDPPGRQVEGHFAIGLKTFAIIQADKHLFVTNGDDDGAAGEEVGKLREALEDAHLTFDDLRAQLADASKRLDEAKRDQVTLAAENTSLRSRVSELEQLLASATAPAAADTKGSANDGDKPAGKPAKK